MAIIPTSYSPPQSDLERGQKWINENWKPREDRAKEGLKELPKVIVELILQYYSPSPGMVGMISLDWAQRKLADLFCWAGKIELEFCWKWKIENTNENPNKTENIKQKIIDLYTGLRLVTDCPFPRYTDAHWPSMSESMIRYRNHLGIEMIVIKTIELVTEDIGLYAYCVNTTRRSLYSAMRKTNSQQSLDDFSTWNTQLEAGQDPFSDNLRGDLWGNHLPWLCQTESEYFCIPQKKRTYPVGLFQPLLFMTITSDLANKMFPQYMLDPSMKNLSQVLPREIEETGSSWELPSALIQCERKREIWHVLPPTCPAFSSQDFSIEKFNVRKYLETIPCKERSSSPSLAQMKNVLSRIFQWTFSDPRQETRLIEAWLSSSIIHRSRTGLKWNDMTAPVLRIQDENGEEAIAILLGGGCLAPLCNLFFVGTTQVWAATATSIACKFQIVDWSQLSAEKATHLNLKSLTITSWAELEKRSLLLQIRKLEEQLSQEQRKKPQIPSAS